MAFHVPDDLEKLDLTLKQVRAIIELRREKSRVANRLLLLPEKEKALKAEIVELQEQEDRMLRVAEQTERKE